MKDIKKWKNFVVTREDVIEVTPDCHDGKEERVVSVIREGGNLNEVILPSDLRFRQAVDATK